jgi:predicted MPP superfamily phosphohydrolase
VLGLALVGLGSAACEVGLGAWLLLRRPGEVTFARALRAAWLVALLSAAKALALLTLLPHRSFFLLVLLGWCAAVVGLPCLGLITLWAARRRAIAPAVRAGAWAALPLCCLGAWGSFVEPRRLQVETARVAVDARRALPRPLRVGVLADLQTRSVGAHERRAVDELLALAPDLILLPGDVAQIWPRAPADARAEFRALLARLEAPLGVFAVRGNSDDRDFLESILQGTRVRLLDDESVHLEHAGARVALCGVDLDYGSRSAREAVDALVSGSGADELRLVVAHLPDAVSVLPAAGVDLLIAGHTHGGQVVVPGFGPPLTLTSVPREVAAGGLWELDGRRLYVSRGVGMERGWAPPLRLFCAPEVTLLVFEGDVAER